MDIKRKLKHAQIKLLCEQPFYAALLLRLPLVEDPHLQFPAATDGKSIFYNPTQIDKMTASEVCGVLCHEVLHCVSGHPWRRDQRMQAKWNIATDGAINPLVIESGLSLPKGAILEKAWAGWSAEKIYNHLPDNPKNNNPHRCTCEVRDTPPDGQGNAPSPDELDAEWTVAVTQAAMTAKAYGKLPAHLERFAAEIVKPKTDPKNLLRRFIQASARNDYTWKQPNRRYIASGLYLPSIQSESMPPIVIAIDTSGSIDSDTFNQMTAELAEIIREVRPEKTHVVYCDAGIQASEEYEPDDEIKFRTTGGGGTDFRPVFDWTEKQGIEPACLIYMTDMQGSFPKVPPPYPVLWFIFGEHTNAPFGETVHVKE